jgi:hypothetical protein
MTYAAPCQESNNLTWEHGLVWYSALALTITTTHCHWTGISNHGLYFWELRSDKYIGRQWSRGH